ncbi:aromatic-ring-hydroxylating dioxygenase subunit beta [Haloarchaeobius sp. HRN-SO-5]|uniref:aromatic-ring-hydroxylating dioxygenase subunit beta n=1 Tax=Haloarchaeobius sp. HRN-SO-5 TaxID=3446118 RepID=UPI003EBB5921
MSETTERKSEMERHYECVAFYNREAELLDDKELEEWLTMLTEDVRYDMPIRVSREKTAERSEFSVEGYNYREDYSTLEARVERFQSEFAWSEDPPSRTRHFVTNVRVEDVDGDELTVKTNLLLYRGQGEDTDGTVLSAERVDTLRRVDDDLKLAERDIHLDHTVLPMKNISVFF